MTGFAFGPMFKRPPYRASKAEWTELQATVGYGCAHCGSATGTELAHVVDRSDGGDDVAQNLLRLCGDFGGCRLHARRHRPGSQDNPRLIRSKMRRAMSPENVAYGVGFYGPERFDELYPPPAEAAA